MIAQYRCRGSEDRRQAVRDNAQYNGIDYVEVTPAAVKPVELAEIDIHFIRKPSGLTTSNFQIDGGDRITPIRIHDFINSDPNDVVVRLEVTNGDYSTYTLRLIKGPGESDPPPFYDPQLAIVEFSFKVECPSDFDCKPGCACHPERVAEPEIDYLAKDYSTFRRLMLDRLSLLLPDWRERNPADGGIALVEALAYAADHLSYQQDSVATEAYLGTARRRVSVRRHARLVDYAMHDGCNARVWVQLRVTSDLRRPNAAAPPIVPTSTQLLTRTEGLSTVILPANLPPGLEAEVFETMHSLPDLYQAHNAMPFYTWSAKSCCLPKGATRATLAGHFPDLAAGQVLILKEILGAETGEPVDADPRHIHAVRLTRAAASESLGAPLKDPVTGAAITELEWCAADALPFPLCVSAHFETGDRDVSVALGNIVLADHGRSITTPEDTILPPVPKPNPALAVVAPSTGCNRPERETAPLRFRPAIAQTPLTRAATADLSASAASAFRWTMREVAPAIELRDEDDNRWLPQRDLLASDNLAREFVVEADDGETFLRFGDDRHGRRPDAGTAFRAIYRAGNGRRGNAGPEAVAHIVIAQPAGVIADVRQTIIGVTNPLPARGGVDPEPIEDVRQKAPVAFRTLERAVTERDYEEIAQRHPEVQRAAATIRWTGSWHTVYLTIDRMAGRKVDLAFERELRAFVDRYRMAGIDVEIDAPRFISLELEMLVCVKNDYFRSDVERTVLAALGSSNLPDGRQGLFHPDRFTFGQPVYLSQVYATVHEVTGVDSVDIRVFQRQGSRDNEGVAAGTIPIDRLEIARLDSDRNFPERGSIRLSLGGGR